MATVMNQSIRRYIQTTAKRGAQVDGPSAVSGGVEGSYKIWKKLALYIAFPSIIICSINCFLAYKNRGHEKPPFIKYDHLRIRTKRFPWGDGNHSMFHNPEVNALPDGYESEH